MARPNAQTEVLLTAAVLFLFPLAALPLVLSDTAAADVTAYDELWLRGFPRGLLPANVRGYTLDAGSGDFAVDLISSCRIVLPAGSYLASFSDRLTGRLDDRRISGLSGIRVRAFFRWWTITGIRADGDDLVFEVGFVSAKFPARPFNASLECPGRKRQPGMEGVGVAVASSCFFVITVGLLLLLIWRQLFL
ncbi:hypothetical protein E2562_003730 [Oryza meyeriana var. granulata]|uniref:Legume lectin domain-containing protein n=1 Tax=Oryza meyeriana var. granulata TaxID=110450 RepID=A0A6G1BQ70_9ORYZ|nr:hypothetical protein E2562_003730 [Oryza meyeriana var. granulata]